MTVNESSLENLVTQFKLVKIFVHACFYFNEPFGFQLKENNSSLLQMFVAEANVQRPPLA